jgi:uncharacterized protein (DUF362 family)
MAHVHSFSKPKDDFVFSGKLSEQIRARSSEQNIDNQKMIMNKTPLGIVDFNSYKESVPALMEVLGADRILCDQKNVVIKPNLVNTSPPPITTPVQLVAAIADYVKSVSNAKIVIAEGCGAPIYNTHRPFRKLGYSDLAKSNGMVLVDLNDAETTELADHRCRVFPKFMMPRLIMDSFLISVPVLKKHFLAKVTLTMKNMLGCAPSDHYSGLIWKKSRFHKNLHRSIFEMNLYRTPDLTILDASVGLACHHLGGPKCRPHVNKLIGGFDPVAVDACGATLLGVNWKDVEHISLAHTVIGRAD